MSLILITGKKVALPIFKRTFSSPDISKSNGLFASVFTPNKFSPCSFFISNQDVPVGSKVMTTSSPTLFTSTIDSGLDPLPTSNTVNASSSDPSGSVDSLSSTSSSLFSLPSSCSDHDEVLLHVFYELTLSC